MEEQEEENRYLLFAGAAINEPRVSRTVGAAIVEQRMAVNLPQDVAAARAGIPTRLLSDIENGRRQPSISGILALSEAIGIDPRDLFNRALEFMKYPVGYVPVSNFQPSQDVGTPYATEPASRKEHEHGG